MVVFWTACADDSQNVSPDANAASGKPAAGAFIVTSSLDGYTLTITVDQSKTQAASHLLLQLTDCNGAYVTNAAVVSSSVPVTYTTGIGTGCTVGNDGAFIKFDNLDVFQNQTTFTITITFNIPINTGAIKIKSALGCFPFALTFTPNCPITETHKETAFAYDNTGKATCFLDMTFPDPNFKINRWGWTNGAYGEGSYILDLYAGAGQCDLTKGTLVGNVTVVYSAGTATVTYNVNAPYVLYDTHLYVGSATLASKCTTKKNVTTCTPTVAPGQFPYIGGSTSYTVTGLTGNIYVVAHAVVGDFLP